MNQETTAGDVTVVVCVRNVEETIGPCLDSIVKNEPKEIIVVDGDSTDRTMEIAKEYADQFVSDQGKGLAYARRLGAALATGDEVLYVGPDNILPPDFISRLVELKKDSGFDVVSVQTRLESVETIWDRGLDFRWIRLMGTPGPTSVAGTPSMYTRSLFDLVTFSEEDLGPNDDTQIASELLEQGKSIGIVPLVVWEAGGNKLKDIWKRYYWYGTGDTLFYRANAPHWTLRRRIKSLTHPLRQTLRYAGSSLIRLRFGALPFLFVTMVARYTGWAKGPKE